MDCTRPHFETLRVQPGDIVIARLNLDATDCEVQAVIVALRSVLDTAGLSENRGLVVRGDVDFTALPRSTIEALLADAPSE